MSAVDPALIGGAVVAIAIVSAAAYATLTNGEAAVDVDGDGDDDIVFGDTDTQEETSTVDLSGESPDSVERESGGSPVDLSADGEADVSGSAGETTLDDVFVSDDLQVIDGVGPAREAALRGAGFQSVESIHEASPAALQQAEGIGLSRAASIKQAASEFLEEA